MKGVQEMNFSKISSVIGAVLMLIMACVNANLGRLEWVVIYMGVAIMETMIYVRRDWE